MKTCNFRNDACIQKSICDQIIEGLLGGDTVKHLLQEKDLSLDKTIRMCQGQEAAKKQRAAIQHGPSHLHESITALKTPTEKGALTTSPLSRLRSQATPSRAHTMPCVSCILSQLQESRSLCQSLPLQTSPTY